MKITKQWAMPNSNTFSIKPIREFIYSGICKYDKPVIVDPFVRNSPFKEISISNDLDASIKADYNMDALDFLKIFSDDSVDIVLFDPPYSPRQISECYKKQNKSVNMQTTQASFWSDIKKEIGRIIKPKGRCFTFGWNSGGVGVKYGFSQVEILMVAHGGWHNDTICVEEIKNDHT